VWVMVPAGKITDSVVDALAGVLEPGDMVIDGGNTKFTDDEIHARQLDAKGIGFMDVGVSGGVWGLENGYGLMVGGSKEQVEHLMPVFDALRPEGPREEGFVHAGPVGAGHYTKMVHNGIEYAIMQAYAEGYELLAAKKEYALDLRQIAAVWNRGSVVRSWMNELAERAFARDPALAGLRGYVEDSGEGRWTVQEAIDLDVPAPAIALSLFARFRSRQEESFGARVIAALRNEFGGHPVKRA